MNFLNQIKEYEEKKFKEYALKRELLHNSLQSVQCKELSNIQLENMVCDIKEITLQLDVAVLAIDQFIENAKSQFHSTQSRDDLIFRFKYALYLSYMLTSDSVSDSDSDSVSESELSDSESSSRSDSLTFSS
jgi:hypothetical protein